jgi:arsenate reductase-like glutaredoxin family protein
MSDTFLDNFKDDSQSALDEVMSYVHVMETLQQDIDDLNDKLKEKQATFDELSKEMLPNLLSQNGLDELSLSNGRKLKIKEDVYISVPKNDSGKKAVLDWLKDNGGADLIHDELSIDAPTDSVKSYIKDQNIPFNEALSVNTNTFKAWTKAKLGMTKGSIQSIAINQFPKEANLFVERRAEIK